MEEIEVTRKVPKTTYEEKQVTRYKVGDKIFYTKEQAEKYENSCKNLEDAWNDIEIFPKMSSSDFIRLYNNRYDIDMYIYFRTKKSYSYFSETHKCLALEGGEFFPILYNVSFDDSGDSRFFHSCSIESDEIEEILEKFKQKCEFLDKILKETI